MSKHEYKKASAKGKGKSRTVPKGYHRMPDGSLMKGSKHKGKK